MTSRVTNSAFDEIVDIAVVGSGAGGLTGAVIAARNGLKPVVFEKASLWGGTTALSGGAVWIPGNRLQLNAGLKDSLTTAERYLDEVVGDVGPASNATRRQAYLRGGPAMVDALLAEGIRWSVDPQPDYLTSPHAGRSRDLDAKVFDLKKLGIWRETMRRGPAPFAMTLAEIPSIGRGRSGIASSMTIAKVLARAALGRLLGRDEIGCGASLAGQLMAAALRLGADVRLDSPLVDLIVQDGRAKGLITHRDGLPWRVATRYGVLLAGGGFAHARDLRQRLQGTDGSLSSASPDDTGDMLKLADRLGAMTALLDQAWWATSFLYPGGVPGFFQWERALPFSVVVNSQGARFGNESGDYDSFAKAMIRNGLKTCWLIMDARHRQRYTFGAMKPGVTPEEMIRSGFFHRANTLEQLAHKCGISPGGLLDTVARFNGFVDQGVDRDFRRGDKPYDRHWGDPTIKPNPCLGKIERGPFLAAQIHIGDLGTRGGFVTDEHGRVLDVTGRPIEGLYAAGNCTAAVVGNAYPGPGVTLGPAMTFAYLAMQHASHPNDSAVVA